MSLTGLIGLTFHVLPYDIQTMSHFICPPIHTLSYSTCVDELGLLAIAKDTQALAIYVFVILIKVR